MNVKTVLGLLLVMAFLATAVTLCVKSAPRGVKRAQTIPASKNEVSAAEMPAPAAASAPRKIDLDLGRMSKTIRETWSYRLVESPEEFCGKVVQICGDFYAYDERAGNPRRYVCALKDTAGCCAIGEVEFRLRGKYDWPADFPEEYSPITVNGCLEVARNGDGQAVPRLVEADIVRDARK